jgi:membrane-associated phospholipid phosphatase
VGNVLSLFLLPADGLPPDGGWGFLDTFDYAIISFLNGFARRSWTLDKSIAILHFNPFVKGAPVFAVFWWAWFQGRQERAEKREILLTGFFCCFLALVVTRTLAFTLPFRERPLRNPAFEFQLPFTMTTEHLIGWSAFPSDSAAFYTAIATTLLLVSRCAGVFALLYVSITVLIPRVYFGIHHPSDMLVGAFIGASAASLASFPMMRLRTADPVLAWAEDHPGLFYPGMFILTYQATQIFMPVFEVGQFFVTTMMSLVAQVGR